MDVDDFYYKEAASSSNASGSGLQHLGHGLKEDGQIAVSVFLKLSLPGSNMSDITGLSKYSHLAQVDISFNNICDLSPLGCMKHLLFLDASHNKITKVLDFAPPHNLIQANLSYNDIEEISDLSEHPCLRKLDLSNNNISKVGGLSTCASLTELRLTHNHIQQVDGLARLPLTHLDLSFNWLKKLDSLRTLDALEDLDVSGNQLPSLDGLEDCRVLEVVISEENMIATVDDVRAVRALPLLRSLDLRRNPIEETVNYRLALVLCIPHLTQLDRRKVSADEKVQAVNVFTPPLEVIAADDHRKLMLYSALQPSKVNASTTTSAQYPHPVVVVSSPLPCQRQHLVHRLTREFTDYLSTGVLHSSRRTEPCVAVTTAEEMERMTREGRFVCTAEEPGGHVSALSLESVEFSALCGKACVVALSLQGTMSLQRSHLQPYCILTMPTDPQQLEDILDADDALTDETRQALCDDAADSRDAANAGLFDAVLDTGDLGSAYEELHAWMTHQLVASDDADSRPLTPDSLDDSPPAASARLSVFSAPRWGRGLRSCGVVERSASQSCVEEASGWKRWESAYRALTTTPAAHTVRNTCTAKVEGSQTLTFNVSDPDALPPDSPDSTLPSLPSSRLDRPDSATCCSKSPISDRSARDGGAACGATIEGAADDAEFGLGSSLGSRPGSKCSPYPVLPAIAGR